MPLWTSKDQANGSPLFTPSQVNLAPNTANRDTLFGNTTADAFVTDQTVGVFAVDENEISVGSFYLSAVVANNSGNAGSYVPGDILSTNVTGATYSKSATVKVAKTAIRTAVPLTGHLGSGYSNDDTVTINSVVWSANAILTVTTGAANTSIASLAVTNAGSFGENPVLANVDLVNVDVANSSANGAQATLTMEISTIEVGDPGNYSVKPSNTTAMTTSNGSGNGVTLVATFSQHSDKGIPHTGWVKKTVGSGGREGRVQYEVLVAGGITSDASDDSELPDN